MWKGSLVALVTPMKSDGMMDFVTLKKLLEWHALEQTDGIVLLGTTGESPTIREHERAQIIKLAVEVCRGQLPIIVGTGANCTYHAIEMTKQAYELGADAVLLVTPYYNKPTQEGLFQHFSAIAKAVPIPQILYNIPSRTACDMLPETVARLAQLKNIMAIKETVSDLARLAQIQALCDIDIFSGDDIRALGYIRQGAKGVISVAANLIPRAMHDLCVAALSGDWKKADEIDAKYRRFFELLFVETNPIPTKWAMFEMGLIEAGIRLPLTPLNARYHADLRAALQQL